MVFSLNKEGNYHTAITWMNLGDIMLSAIMLDTARFPLNEVRTVVKIIGTESRMLVVTSWWKGGWGVSV